MATVHNKENRAKLGKAKPNTIPNELFHILWKSFQKFL